ncbi:MAG TPA: hypothetical protein GXX36_04640 [Clostridiaceae bacterium]|nr:hypothetical protein [Clostridiaceae bacterium]
MAIKVGIPRGLFYYRYYPLWKTFLEELGADVVLSDHTNKRILDEGVKSCVDEACLPVKVFHGHVLNLKDRVDYLFIPRLTSISKDEYICPKIGGIPDMVKNTIKGLPQIIDTEINVRRSHKNMWKAVMEIGSYFSDNKFQIRKAYNKAQKVQDMYDGAVRKGRLPSDILNSFQGDNTNFSLIRMDENPDRMDVSLNRADVNPNRNDVRANHGSMQRGQSLLNILVIGHPYNLYDSYINMDLVKKLRNNGVNLITVDMQDESTINKKASFLNKPMFWNFGRLAIGTAMHMLEKGNIDGIIYLMSFGCGVDSFVCDLTEKRVKRMSTIPFIVLTIDEHSGEAGMNTRVEAFIDMIRWRKKDESNISALR